MSGFRSQHSKLRKVCTKPRSLAFLRGNWKSRQHWLCGSEARRAPPVGRRVWAPRAAAAPCPRSSPRVAGGPPHPSSCGPGRLRRRQRSRGYTSCGHDRSWPSPASRVLREAASVRPPLHAPAAQSDRSAGRETRSTVPTGSTVPTAPCDPARGPTAGAWDSACLSCLSYEFRL